MSAFYTVNGLILDFPHFRVSGIPCAFPINHSRNKKSGSYPREVYWASFVSPTRAKKVYNQTAPAYGN